MNVRALFAFLFFSFCLLTPSHADWLVTVDGTQVETQGPFKVDGRRIVFKTTTGTLSAMRASEVDLEASQRLSDARARAQRATSNAAPTNEARPAALVLNENNTGRHLSFGTADDADPDAAATDGEAEAGLEVLSWNETQGPTEDLVLVGRARNNTEIFATEMSLSVTVQDETGKVAGRASATFDHKALRPGQETTWRATFPGVYMSRDPKFESKTSGFVTRNSSDGSAVGATDQGSEEGTEEDVRDADQDESESSDN